MFLFAAKQAIQAKINNDKPQEPDISLFVHNPSREYKIVLAQRPDKALESSGNSVDRFKAMVYTANGKASQRWRIISEPNGRYSIYNSQSGGTLQIPDYSNGQKGTHIHVSQPNNTINEKWLIVPAKRGYAILSAQNNHCLNALGGNLNDGDKIGLWHFQNRHNDTWLLIPIQASMGPQQIWGQQQQQPIWGGQQQQQQGWQQQGWGQNIQPNQPVQPVIVIGGQGQLGQQNYGHGQQFAQKPFVPNQQQFVPNQQQFVPNQQSFIPNQQQFVPNQQQFVPNQQQFIPNQQQFIPGQGQYGQGQYGQQNISFDPNRQYRIVLAQMQHKCIDSAQNQLIILNYNAGMSQKWRIITVPNDSTIVTFISSQTGGSMEVPQSCGSGTVVYVGQPNNAMNQKWRVNAVNGGYSIRSVTNNLSLNVLGGTCNEADKIGLYPFAGQRNDVWSILPA